MSAYGGAFVIKNAIVKIGGTDFTNQCTSAVLTPDVNIQTLRTLVPDGQLTDIDSPVWTLSLKGIQDWETSGLAAYLHTNSGQVETVIIAPAAGTGKQEATCSVRMVPPPFGGDQGAWATFELDLPVQGQPTFGSQS